MKVLIADKVPTQGRTGLESLGVSVVFRPELSAADLPAALRECQAEILVVRSTEVSRAALEATPTLTLVIRAGAGVNTIDLAAASERGIYVTNCPGKNAIAVAELAMGLLLALDRRIVDATVELRNGRWNKKEFGQAAGLFGRTLGLIGYGAIAQELAERARAFGMHIQTHSVPPPPEDVIARDGVRVVADLDTLLATSDAVSIHVPYGRATHHLLDERRLGLMKPGAILLHTARGGIVDDQALHAAVSAGKLRAGLDVFEQEPAAATAVFESPLRNTSGVYFTPHIGASTEQAEIATAHEVVRIVREYLATGSVPNVVNVTAHRPAKWTLVVRHLDRVGVLAHVLAALREQSLNVKEMQNVIFSGNQAAVATITLESEPSAELLRSLRAQDHVLGVELRASIVAP